jgi:2-polyprenyl-6-methoxyphenol hydroxylase-like FAD-dependent oxidoreductase
MGYRSRGAAGDRAPGCGRDRSTRRAAMTDRRQRHRRSAELFRQAFGDGWTLVGDAAYHKDPIIAQVISDAFRAAEWLADAVHAGFSGARPLIEALAEYQRVRDEHFAPMYELSCSLATLEPHHPRCWPSTKRFVATQSKETDFSALSAAPFPRPNITHPRICTGLSALRRRETELLPDACFERRELFF